MGPASRSGLPDVPVCQLVQQSSDCPIPMTEDRLMECFHHATRFEDDYHDPQAVRFNLNALVTAISSVSEIAQKEIEQRGNIARWKDLRRSFLDDPWLRAVKKARNTTLHQRAIFDASEVDIGLIEDAVTSSRSPRRYGAVSTAGATQTLGRGRCRSAVSGSRAFGDRRAVRSLASVSKLGSE